MKLISKNILRDEMLGLTHKMVHTKEIQEENFKGIVSLFTILSMEKPMWIQKENKRLCIADVGFQWLQFAPRQENWWLTVVFDSNQKLVESYFDITKENFLENKQNPGFTDMCLDIVFDQTTEPKLLDEDELKAALDEKLITIQEYEMAISLAKRIMNCYNKNKAKYYNWIDRFYNMLR